MSDYLNALAATRRHNVHLRWIIGAVAAVGALGTYQAAQVPKHLNVHLVPNVTVSSTVQVRDGESAVPPPNVYAFAYYIWQQVNRWATDGATDYGAQIFRVQNFITPRCIAQLQGDLQVRVKAGELRQRTRQMSEIPGLGFAANRVIANDSGLDWTVFLDMQIQETFRGQAVKDVYIRYPIRVVRFDVDRERNPWQLAVDCYGSDRPARLEDSQLRAVQVVKAGEPPPTPKAPEVPSRVEPVDLPRAVPLDGATRDVIQP
ncbi:PFL_4703 family integrating conjugative element protein [Pseudorhodoferax sp. Leaf267]|jgi:integrating conjugative element protein (TIGR03746 family)|uniref:PFL_4703 family integrating conjugative element protein n=1 Tax=Pseudorhodoferax sp. Leaf267 TaxID=1736316 RepID=UPI0009E8CB3B|nr:TIGR03746 family integrating conjugative element protein [Pseudorhodoferax sp. Leaf267]